MPGRKRKSEVHSFSWLRENGRLNRLEHPAQVDEDGVVVFNVTKVHAMAFKQFVIDQDVPPKEGPKRKMIRLSDADRDDNSMKLHTLPDLALFRVIDFLDLSDIGRLCQVNTSLVDFFNKDFVKVVVMPARPSALEAVGGRYVLRLTSCCNIRMLKNIENQEFQFDRLNLHMIKELKLIGNNHEFRGTKYRLTNLYKSGLKSILNRVGKNGLLKLELLTDGTDELLEILEIVKKFPNLKELTLHGIGYFNQSASYFNQPKKVQKIIDQVLTSKSIKKLTLQTFTTLNKYIKIKSESLEELRIEFGKNFDLSVLDLPNLRKFYNDNPYDSVYSQMGTNIGKFKNIIANGCPKLEWFNEDNLKDLPEGIQDWTDMYDDWMIKKGPISTKPNN